MKSSYLSLLFLTLMIYLPKLNSSFAQKESSVVENKSSIVQVLPTKIQIKIQAFVPETVKKLPLDISREDKTSFTLIKYLSLQVPAGFVTSGASIAHHLSWLQFIS